MSIPGIKEIDFEQAYLNKPIPKEKSGEKYIAKDFVLNLGGEKIKLKASDSLRDVVRKINLKSHVTGVRAKAVKGQLFLESTSKGRGQPSGITLPQKSYGEGTPLNANQIIANYLASLPEDKLVTVYHSTKSEHNNAFDFGDELENDVHSQDLNELPQLNEPSQSDVEEVDINAIDNKLATIYDLDSPFHSNNIFGWYTPLPPGKKDLINEYLHGVIKQFKTLNPNEPYYDLNLNLPPNAYLNAHINYIFIFNQNQINAIEFCRDMAIEGKISGVFFQHINDIIDQ